MKLSYADVVKKNFPKSPTRKYSKEEMDKIIAESFADAFEEMDDQNKIELDAPMIWTKGFSDKNDDDYPIVKVTNYQEQDNLPDNVKFIATPRQLQEWNDKREKTHEGQKIIKKSIEIQKKQRVEYIERYRKHGHTWIEEVSAEDFAENVKSFFDNPIKKMENKLI